MLHRQHDWPFGKKLLVSNLNWIQQNNLPPWKELTRPERSVRPVERQEKKIRKTQELPDAAILWQVWLPSPSVKRTKSVGQFASKRKSLVLAFGQQLALVSAVNAACASQTLAVVKASSSQRPKSQGAFCKKFKPLPQMKDLEWS